jgi:plasmid maintenance system antidote protein VapI
MPMKNLPRFGLSVTEGAKELGVSRTTLSRLLNGQSGVSSDMAQARQREGRIKVTLYQPRPAA